MSDKKQNTFANKVLEQITKDNVSMKPKWHFVIRTLLFAAGACILLLLVLYAVSFALFALRENGLLFLPAFGFRGVLVFIFSLPWILVLASIAFVVLLEILVRKYSFAYRKPLLYSIGIILVLIITGSFAVARIGLHESVWSFTQKRHIPFVDTFYRGFMMPHNRGVNPVSISTTTEDGFFAIDRDGEAVFIIIGSSTSLPAGFDFVEGDEVVILGERKKMFGSTTIDAMGVHPIRKIPGRRSIHERPLFMNRR